MSTASSNTVTVSNVKPVKDEDALDIWGISSDVNPMHTPIKASSHKPKPKQKQKEKTKKVKRTESNTNSSTKHRLQVPSTQNTEQRKASNIDPQLKWLNEVGSSSVLLRNEIESILNVDSLNGRQKDIAQQRLKTVRMFTKCKETRRWSGLCGADAVQRIQNTIEQLQSNKKSIDTKMITLFRTKHPTDQTFVERSHCIKAIKQMQALLSFYHDLVKEIRKRERNKNNTKPKPKAKTVQQQQQQQRQQQQPQQYQQRQTQSAWWSFGRSKDKWNFDIDPEFCTLFRGHVLSDTNYEDYCSLKEEILYDLNHNINNENNDSMDIAIDVDNDGDISLLGASCSYPPDIDAIRTFRAKTNEHQSTFIANLKLLYGEEYKKYISLNANGSDGRYTAHLLSKYDMLERVGSGVYGQVFKAKTKATNKLVAIKTLQLLLTGKQRENEDLRQNKLRKQHAALVNDICPYMMSEGIPVPVIREIMSLKQLNHINITKLYDIVLNDPRQIDLALDDPLRAVSVVAYNKLDETESCQWNLHLVEEFVPNELHAIMRNLKLLHLERMNTNYNIDNLNPQTLPQDPHWFSCANIKSMIHDMLNGLKYLQSESYVHRDLKPANLLLTDDGMVKIADFGLSRPKYKNNEALTNYHNVVTRYYRAPEILIEQNKRRSQYGCASDMWSIGTIFAELLCGRPIFRAPSDVEQILFIIHKCGSISDEIWPGISTIITEDPPPGFVKKDPITKKPNKWHHGHAKYNFLNSLRPEYRNKSRQLSSFLTPYISRSWTKQNQTLGLDLIDKMLTYDPAQRITPHEALQHQWFKVSPAKIPPKELILKAKKSKKSCHTDLQKKLSKAVNVQQQKPQQSRNRGHTYSYSHSQNGARDNRRNRGRGRGRGRGRIRGRGRGRGRERGRMQQQQQRQRPRRQNHEQWSQNARALYDAVPTNNNNNHNNNNNNNKRTFNAVNHHYPNKKRRMN